MGWQVGGCQPDCCEQEGRRGQVGEQRRGRRCRCRAGYASLDRYVSYWAGLTTEEIIRTHPSLNYLSSLLPPTAAQQGLPSPLPANLSTAEHLTVFAPANGAFEVFDDVEKRYLEGDFGGEAIARVLGGGVVKDLGKEQVGWSDYWSRKADNGTCMTESD